METLGPRELRREIDEALEEIDRVEAEMLELFAQILGPDAAARTARQLRSQEQAPRLAPLTKGKKRVTPEASPEPSTPRPETR